MVGVFGAGVDLMFYPTEPEVKDLANQDHKVCCLQWFKYSKLRNSVSVLFPIMSAILRVAN